MSGRSVHPARINHPDVTGAPNVPAVWEEVQTMSRRAVEVEASRTGCRDRARRAVARALQVPTGTVENAERGRLKRPEYGFVQRLRRLIVSALERELGRLTHELEMARASVGDASADRMGAVQAHLDAARKAMEELE